MVTVNTNNCNKQTLKSSLQLSLTQHGHWTDAFCIYAAECVGQKARAASVVAEQCDIITIFKEKGEPNIAILLVLQVGLKGSSAYSFKSAKLVCYYF